MLNTNEDNLKNYWNQGTIDFHCRKKNKYYGSQWCQSSNRSSKYLALCSAEERNSYRFATTWGWV